MKLAGDVRDTQPAGAGAITNVQADVPVALGVLDMGGAAVHRASRWAWVAIVTAPRGRSPGATCGGRANQRPAPETGTGYSDGVTGTSVSRVTMFGPLWKREADMPLDPSWME